MKIMALSDVFVTDEMIRKGVSSVMPGADLEMVHWDVVTSYSEYQDVMIELEQKGPDAVRYEIDMASRVASANPDWLLTHFAPVHREMIEAAGDLKVVGMMRGGTENVDHRAAADRGIPVIHTPGRNNNAVAEFTLGLILSEVKNIARGHAALQNGKWRKRFSAGDFCPELVEQTVGIVGFGEIGRLVAAKCQSFQVEILVHDPYVSDDEIEQRGAQPRPLEDLLEESDVVTLHVRLNEQTRNLIGRDQIERMKPEAYFINTARAGLVEREALYEALRDRRLAGAALDVYWDEPIDVNSPFLNLDNVTLTPHYAGSSSRAITESPAMLLRNIQSYLEEGDTSCLVEDTG